MNSLPVLPQEIQPVTPLVNVFNAVIDGISQLAVNARDLHKFLQVGRDFTTWIKGRIEQYLFIENVDYILTLTKTGERKNVVMTEYHLTLDMAKELAMVENNEQGRKVRRYFIRCEKDLYKSDSQQREVLRQACEKIATGNMLISDAYILVGEHFGYKGGIKDIPTPLLPEATAFVYEMILRLQKTEVNKQPTNKELYEILHAAVSSHHKLHRMTRSLATTLHVRDTIDYQLRDLREQIIKVVKFADNQNLQNRFGQPLVSHQAKLNAWDGASWSIAVTA